MKKKSALLSLLIILLFIGCALHRIEYAAIASNVNIDKHKYQPLINRFLSYWDCMSKKDFQCAYQYELPYQRFLHDFEWYKNFNSANNQKYKIVLLDIISKNNVTMVKSKYVSPDNKVTYVFYDRWYNIDGEWYHKMKVSRLPFGDEEE